MSRQLIEQGLQLHQSGRLIEAKTIYEQYLKLHPRDPDGLHLLGLAWLQSGDPAKAVDLIRSAIQIQTKNPVYFANLGAALVECGNPRDAVLEFQRAVELDPKAPQLQLAFANCHAMCGELPTAEKLLRKLTTQFPAIALGWFNLGNVVRDQQRLEEALDCYRRAIALDARLFEARHNFGNMLHQLGQLEAAEQAYRHALAINAQNPLTHCNLASVLIDRGLFTAAEAAALAAMKLDPRSAVAQTILGAAIGHQGRVHEALACYLRAAELDPENVTNIAAIGAAYCETGNAAAAMPYLQTAEARAPDNLTVQQLLSTALLTQGQWREGWRRASARQPRLQFAENFPAVRLQTRLAGPLENKRIVLLKEQGLGDEIFFLRFAPVLAARGAHLICQCSEKIAAMLQRTGLFSEVIAGNPSLETTADIFLMGDLPCAIGSLLEADSRRGEQPGSTNAAVDNSAFWLPPPLPLSPLPEISTRMRDQLAALGPAPYIGLTWRAGIAPEQQRGAHWTLTKTMDLGKFGSTLAGIDATFIALQRNPHDGEISALAKLIGRPVHDFCALNEELESMLALLALIDDYVGVSNTNMHLRAGVNKPARVLVPRPAEWRWMADGGRSPWFPDFEVYRQSAEGDWDAAMAQLASDLKKSIAR